MFSYFNSLLGWKMTGSDLGAEGLAVKITEVLKRELPDHSAESIKRVTHELVFALLGRRPIVSGSSNKISDSVSN